ncbi:LacI family DNA-binding transcriptional regulator [Liquorilactobacillus capillatus]|uniref:LacI family sugar-binding transcriptional regulator n=1 Tax=Liquorilactobacillus capillatus DSM 19910 TaxID=1423731 RepID=A0A0R1M868_9LACO|nr:LacI family DNA-binding transcriptional regulator [Liquorilactobacillus capillatus]KRL01122.1 LacI family sugar-binding transcriptional regulator [Liquorilactobacillus capillatus DSM 19910]
MVTIYDIAKQTGISKSTISRVVSGHGYVSAAKRKQILATIHQLGYVPNQTAKNLQKQRTNTIGFFSRGYYPLVGEFINIFIHSAAKYNYNVNVYFITSPQDEIDKLNLLMTKQIDAAYILTRFNSWDTIESYAKFGPLATWQRVDSPLIYSNYVDHYPVYLKIIAYLYMKGYRQIGHVLSNPRNANTVARLHAITTFSNSHHDVDQSYQLFYAEQPNAGQDAALKWIASAKRPVVLIFFADYVAAEFSATLRQKGFKVPQDCLVIGTDNSQIARLIGIPTVDLCFRSQARNAFTYLYNQLNQQQLPFEKQEPRQLFRKSELKR